MNNFLDLADFSPGEIAELLDRAAWLERHPEPEALKGKVLADEVRDAYQALDAIQVHTQVLGRDPGRQETRRRLIVPGSGAQARRPRSRRRVHQPRA